MLGATPIRFRAKDAMAIGRQLRIKNFYHQKANGFYIRYCDRRKRKLADWKTQLAQSDHVAVGCDEN